MAKFVRKVLPIIGTAVGAYFGGPTGASIGAQAGSAASDALAPKPKIAAPKVIPIADEEDLERSRRRRSRSGGRAGTLFTDVTDSAGPSAGDRLGP